MKRYLFIGIFCWVLCLILVAFAQAQVTVERSGNTLYFSDGRTFEIRGNVMYGQDGTIYRIRIRPQGLDVYPGFISRPEVENNGGFFYTPRRNSFMDGFLWQNQR